MASGNETTTKFKVDISELKKGIQDANRQIKLANAEFKAASASMESWGKSADGLTAKINQTEKVLKAQKTILNDYKKQLALIEAEYGKNSKEADEMRIKVENQRATVIKTQKSLGDYQKKLADLEAEQKRAADAADEQASAYDDLKKKISDQEKSLESLKTEYASVVLEQGKNSEAAKRLAGQIDSLSGDLKENKGALSDADSAADEFDKSLDDLSESADNAGGGFTVLKGVIVDLVSSGIKMAIGAIKDFASETLEVGKNFDKSMSNVAALSGATGDELQMLRDTAKEFGSTTQFSATQAADALGYMALAGWDAKTSADALGGVLNLAAASGMDLASASDMVTDYMSAFNLTADKSAYFADLLSYAQSHANTTAAGLGEAFKNCAANMNAAGQDVETTTALLSMLANQGLKGSEAGTALTAVMRDMTSKMKDGAIAIGETSVQVMDAQGNYRDLTDILFDVEAATKGMGDAEKATALQSTFTSDSIKGLNLILNSGVRAAADFESDLRGASVTLSGFEKAAAETGIPIDDLKKKLEGAGLSSDSFAKALEWSEGSAELFVETLDEWMPAGKRAGDILSELGISLDDLQGAMDSSSGSAESMSKVMNDNLAGDMTALGSKIEGVQIALFEKFEPALRQGAAMVSDFVDAVGEYLPVVVDWFSKQFEKIKPIVEGVFKLLAPVVKTGINALKPIIAGIGSVINAILPVIERGINWLLNNLPLVKAVLVGLAAAVGAYVAYTTALTVMKKGWMALTIAQKAAAVAQKALAAGQKILNAVMSANPIGLVVAAIAGLVTAFVVLWKKSEGFRKFWIDLWEKIKSVASAVWQAISGFFTAAWDKIKAVWGGITGFFSGLWEGIKRIFSTIADWINTNVFQPIMAFFQPVIDFFTTAWNIIKELAVGCWNAIKAIWEVVSTWFNENIIQPVSGFFSGLWDGISSAASTAWNAIKGVWSAVKGWFTNNVVNPVKNAFSAAWDALKNGASKAWDGIKSVFTPIVDWFKDKFSNAWQAVKDVFSTGGKIFDGIKDGIVSAFKAVVNAIIRGINKVIAIPFNAINGILDKIRNASILGYHPFENLISRFDVPQIPELKQGGVLKRGQVGLLEGDGAEAVVPLENNKKWIAATAAELKKALTSEGVIGVHGGASSAVTNNYNFTQNNTSPKALSRLEIYRQSKNLLQLKGAT